MRVDSPSLLANFGSVSVSGKIRIPGGSMAASKGSALALAAVLQLLLLLAGKAVPCAGQATSLQKCFWPLNDTETRTLSVVTLGLDYFPYDLSYVTTCVNVGLTCSADGYVTHIDWPYKEIRGELPSDIFQLAHLEFLSLRDNFLHGSIPSEIGNLVNLTSLDLTNNSFSGPFPTSFSRLTKLSYLYLSLNKFSGSIDAIGNIISLNELHLSHNLLSGTIPQSFSAMTSLRSIWLGNNLFTGPLAPLTALYSLTTISMCCNRFNGSIPTFASNPTDFDVSVNDLTGPLPSGPEPADGLNFNVSYNRLSGEIPFDFNAAIFSTLDISHNNLSGRAFFTGKKGGAFFSLISTVNFAHNRFSGAIDPSLSTLTYLYDLDISGNLLTGSIPAFISRLTYLTVLDLSSNQFTGTVPPAVSNPTGLVSINLAHNLLQGSIPRALSRLSSLTYLNMSSNQLSGDITPALSPLRSLEIVDISANTLNGSVPLFFGRMPNMTHMNMAINLLSGSLPPSIFNLRQLSYLNVSRNRLSGPLPNAAASPALIIDLSFNTLSGSLERRHINLKRLATLALHHNQLSGPIPEYLCQSVLQIMLLGSNAFWGALPQCLPFLSSVQLIDVSNNMLFMDAATFQNMPAISLDLRSNYLYGSLSPSPNITLSSSSSSPPIPSLVLPATPQPQSLPPWAVQDATNSQWVWVTQVEQQKGTGAGGEGGGNSSAVAWLAVEGNCLGSEGLGQQRGATECAAVCGIEPGQGPCGGAGVGQCVVQSGWPPSLSCSCASGYVAVTAAGTANTTTCELPPSSPPVASLSTGALVGIVLGCFAGFMLLAAMLAWLLWPRGPKKWEGLDVCEQFSLQQMLKATNNWSEDNVLGKGGFGIVYKGRSSQGQLWAIKRSTIMTNDFETEVRAMASLHHVHLVRLLGFCLDQNVETGRQEQILVYEFIDNRDLHYHIHATKRPLSLRQRLRLAQGTAEGLAYLHGFDTTIVHRDIKPANILVTANMHAKLADFGLLKRLTHGDTDATRVAGTPGYVDPDYNRTNIITAKSDVFSFGIVLLELLSGKSTHVGVDEKTHIIKWAMKRVEEYELEELRDSKMPAVTEEALVDFADLALDCIKSPGTRRPTMKDVAYRLSALIAKHCPDREDEWEIVARDDSARNEGVSSRDVSGLSFGDGGREPKGSYGSQSGVSSFMLGSMGDGVRSWLQSKPTKGR